MGTKTIRRKLSGTVACARAAEHFARKARAALASEGLPDEQVHAGRKDIKRARAAVCLLRDAVGTRRFRKVNDALRDAAHALNPLRDAKVLTQTLQQLLAKHAALRPIGAPLLATLRAEQARAHRSLIDSAELRQVRRTLRECAARVRDCGCSAETFAPDMRVLCANNNYGGVSAA